ncbi:MAG: HNH endonuclease [Armatimonadetes bacterium]|nr:HNH endonuclease [Armatimonadota bacterium]
MPPVPAPQYRYSFEREPIAPSLRFRVLRRDGYRCQLCGTSAADGSKLEVDHKTPVMHGGNNDEANLWTLCFDCNRGKGALSL